MRVLVLDTHHALNVRPRELYMGLLGAACWVFVNQSRASSSAGNLQDDRDATSYRNCGQVCAQSLLEP